MKKLNTFLLGVFFLANAACFVDELYGVNHKSERSGPVVPPSSSDPGTPPAQPPPATEPPPPSTGTGGSGGPLGFNQMNIADGAVNAAYWINVPPSYDQSVPMPILYVYHGQGGNGQQMTQAWVADSNAGGFIVAGLTSQGVGWNFNTDVTATNLMIDDTDALYNIDTQRRYIMGYSAGAHWTHAVALSNSQFFAAYGVVAGAMAATGVTPADAVRQIPVAIVHRQDDAVVPFAQGQNDAQALQNAGHSVYTLFPASGGHAYLPATDNPFIWGNIQQHTLQNPP